MLKVGQHFQFKELNFKTREGGREGGDIIFILANGCLLTAVILTWS